MDKIFFFFPSSSLASSRVKKKHECEDTNLIPGVHEKLLGSSWWEYIAKISDKKENWEGELSLRKFMLIYVFYVFFNHL